MPPETSSHILGRTFQKRTWAKNKPKRIKNIRILADFFLSSTPKTTFGTTSPLPPETSPWPMDLFHSSRVKVSLERLGGKKSILEVKCGNGRELLQQLQELVAWLYFCWKLVGYKGQNRFCKMFFLVSAHAVVWMLPRSWKWLSILLIMQMVEFEGTTAKSVGSLEIGTVLIYQWRFIKLQ